MLLYIVTILGTLIVAGAVFEPRYTALLNRVHDLESESSFDDHIAHIVEAGFLVDETKPHGIWFLR